MASIEERLAALPASQQAALRWFADRQGTEIGWPKPVDGLFLLNKAKGIHKPAGWQHALSVRQSLGGPYTDKALEMLPDGTWLFDYFQEGADPSKRDSDYTNVALMRNLADGVPVAVVHQVKAKPEPRYLVMGLAVVMGWKDGYFSLAGKLPPTSATGVAASDNEPAAPISLEDARRRIERAIMTRQGAGAFRAAALDAFSSRCAISGCEVEHVLEAAHIVPYLGTHTNTLANTLLLRADLHTLFDRGLLTVDPDTFIVSLSASLREGSYGGLEGQPLSLPRQDHDQWRASLRQRAGMAQRAKANG